jgi:hypothetical protein
MFPKFLSTEIQQKLPTFLTGEDIRKGCRRVNKYVLTYENGKLRPIETLPGVGRKEIKENDGGGEFNYYI